MIKEIKNTVTPPNEEIETIKQPYFVKHYNEKIRYVYFNSMSRRFEVIEVSTGDIVNHNRTATYQLGKTQIKLGGSQYDIIKGEIKFENV